MARTGLFLSVLLSLTITVQAMNADHCVPNPCEQVCTNTLVGFECSCLPGYEIVNNKACVDVDECEEVDLCEQKCTNTYGSFKCSCYHGYKVHGGNKRRCVDVNECHHPSPCQQICYNVPGSFTCACHHGFTVHPHNPKYCEPIPIKDHKCAREGDVGFVVLSRRPLGQGNVRKIKKFAEALAEHFEKGNLQVQGLQRYSKSQLYKGPVGIYYVLSQLHRIFQDNRPYIPDIVIIITDNRLSHSYKTVPVVEHFQKAEVFCIIVGRYFRPGTVLEQACQTHRIFHVMGYAELVQIAWIVAHNICNASGGYPGLEYGRG